MNNTLKHYDRNALKGMFYLKGYDKYIQAAAEMLCCDERTAITKINRERMTHEDTLMLAQGLELSVREYLNVFCKDVFDFDNKKE